MNTWDPRIPLPNGIEKCICWHLVLDTRPRVVPSQLMHSWWKMRSHHYREIIDAPGMLRMGLQLPSLARDLLEFIANSVVTACENVMPLTRMDFRVEWWLIRNRVLPVIRKPFPEKCLISSRIWNSKLNCKLCLECRQGEYISSSHEEMFNMKSWPNRVAVFEIKTQPSAPRQSLSGGWAPCSIIPERKIKEICAKTDTIEQKTGAHNLLDSKWQDGYLDRLYFAVKCLNTCGLPQITATRIT